MTQDERDEMKKLVDKAKADSEESRSGEYYYKVRGPPWSMKIVKVRKI